MKKKLFAILSLSFVFQFVAGQRLDKYPVKHPQGYVCYQTKEKIVVDGNLNEKSWQNSSWTKEFADIEGDKKPAPYFTTKAKMLWDEQYLYIAAELQESHIWANLKKRDTIIFYDNDFEVFIDPDGDNHLYYEFEMNALNTVWDLMLIKPYKDGGPAINSWDISGLLSGTKIYGTINNPNDTDKKWTVEIAFPWSVFDEAAFHKGHPDDGEQWRISFSRVEWQVDIEGGEYRKRTDNNGKQLPEYNWTWPEQGVINMHRPETWGYVQFSTGIAGSETVLFQEDPFFDLKMALMEVYYQEKEFFQENGHYTNELEKLNLSDFNLQNFGKDIHIDVLLERFIASIRKNNTLWSVNEESKLSSNKF